LINWTIDADISKAWTPPSEFYTSAEVLNQTREFVFAPSWQFLADLDSLRAPGSVVPLTLLEGFLDEPIVVTRDMDDTLHVLSNVCTHRGMKVAETGGNERYLRCRYHGRRFDLAGRFQHMPEFEGVQNFPCEADSLPKIPHAKWGKYLFASVEPRLSFESWAGPMLHRLAWLPLHEFRYSPERSRDYLVNANWALYVDNYLEGFHIPFVHSGLNELLDYGNYRTEHYEASNLQIAVANSNEHSFELPPSSPDVGQSIAAYYYWLFPNTMFNFYPWGLSINIVRPLGPSITKVSFLCYVWREEKLASGAGAQLDRVEREDEVIVEAVQQGVRSRLYDRGRYSVSRESNVWHFHRLIAQQMRSAGSP
jgi:choline monooxygenase